MSDIEYLLVGRIGRPHGVNGMLLLEIHTEFPDRLNDLQAVYVGPRRRKYDLLSARRHGQEMLMRVQGIEDRPAAETLRGQQVFVRVGDAAPLPPGRYYLHQVEGLEVITDAGERLGRVMKILQTGGANDVYVVRDEAGAEILLPAIPPVILEYDLAGGQLRVHLLEGLR